MRSTTSSTATANGVISATAYDSRTRHNQNVADPRADIAGVFDRAAETYDAVGVDFFGRIAGYLLGDLALQPGERVLDIGTGRGAVLLPAAAAVGATGHVTGIDLAAGMVSATQADINNNGIANADVRIDDAQEPTLDPSSYDVITASLVLFFLPDPPAALRRYRNALRPGGRIGFTTFAGDDPRWSWMEEGRKRFMGEAGQPPPGAKHFANDETITSLVTSAGFVDVVHHRYVFDVRFDNVDQWWRWTWSQGMRVVWEKLDDDAMATVRTYIDEHLKTIANPDGSIIYVQPVRTTVATRD